MERDYQDYMADGDSEEYESFEGSKEEEYEYLYNNKREQTANMLSTCTETIQQVLNNLR